MDVLSTVTSSSLHVDVHDDTTSPATVHAVQDATFYAAPGSSVSSTQLQQVFGSGVDEAWVLPQAQDFALVWPGWNVSPSGTRVTWTLDDVRGPGRFALFESGSFGSIRLLLSDSGTPGSFSYDEHGHGSWAFTSQGVYCLDSTFSTGSGGDRRADSATLLLAVGDVDPERVTEEMCGKTPEEIVEGDSRPGTSPAPAASSELTGGARGPVREANAAVTTAGGTVDVFAGTDQAGRWVSLWWYSTPHDLGWHRVASDGWARGVPVAATTAGAHKIAALDRDGDLIGWAPVTVTRAAPDPVPDPAPPRDPVPGGPEPGAIPAGTEVCTPTPVTRQVSAADADVAASGHVDFGSQLVGGELVARAKDDAGVWRDPAGLVLHVSDAARGAVPGGYGFLGTPGSTIWTIPESQAGGVPWLGWNTQHPSVTSGLSGPVTFTLAGVDGPGDLIVYMSGTFGSANQRVFDTVGGPRSISVPLNTHQHANWVFTQPGAYHVTITQTGTTASGRRVSATGVVHVFVGSGDPRAAAASTTVTEWVGRTASGAECALSADQLASVTGSTDAADPLTARSAAQVDAAAAVLQAQDGETEADGGTAIDGDQQAAGAEPASVSPAGRGFLAGVLGALATLALAGAVPTGRAWWRGQTQETTR
jgi:putative ABC transporter-associated repeat protein